MQDQYRAYKQYRIWSAVAWSLFILATAIFYDHSSVNWSQIFIFMAAAVICELAPVELGRDCILVALTLPVVVMTMIFHGPLATIVLSGTSYLVATVVSWTCAQLATRFGSSQSNRNNHLSGAKAFVFDILLPWIGRPWFNIPTRSTKWFLMNLLSNSAEYIGTVGLAAYVYLLVGKHLLGVSPALELSYLDWVQVAFGGVAALFAFLLLDVIAVSLTQIVHESNPAYTKSLSGFVLGLNIKMRQNLPAMLGSNIFLGALSVLLIYLYLQIGSIAILVLFGPLYMIRDAVRQTFVQVQSYRDTVTALGTYMQRYHPYTRGHLKRVADLSERLARELRLPPKSIMLMPDAGMLHDIGKVSVSEEILDKIGKLSDEEWAIIKQHPVKGAEIVSHLPYLEDIVDWVKYHHKWADGSGYPDDGKKDGQIPTEAAIIAVADAFDAMTDDRDLSIDWVCDSCGYAPEDGIRPDACPQCGMVKGRVYRQPLSLDEAVDQLRRGAGSQFSPAVVKAFLRMLERDGVHIAA